MTFGKYKGYEFSDIPTDYLLWIDDNIPSTSDNCEPYFRMACKVFIKRELKRRSGPPIGELQANELNN